MHGNVSELFYSTRGYVELTALDHLCFARCASSVRYLSIAISLQVRGLYRGVTAPVTGGALETGTRLPSLSCA